MTAPQLTIDVTFDPRILASVLKACTEVVEHAAGRIERLEVQARTDGDERRQLRDRLKLKDDYITDLLDQIADLNAQVKALRAGADGP